MKTIFGEENFFNKQMATFYKMQDNMVYDKMSSAIKMYMPQIEINREQLERWVNLCVKLDNIDKTDLINMATQKKFEELKDQLELTEKALELACERVKYFEEMQDKEMGCFEFFGYNTDYDLQAIIEQYKEQAKEMMKSE